MTILSLLALFGNLATASSFSTQLCTTKVGTKSIKPVPSTTYALTITLTTTARVTSTPVTTTTPRAVTTTVSTTKVVTVTTTAPTNTGTITTTVTSEDRALGLSNHHWREPFIDTGTTTTTSTSTEIDTETASTTTTNNGGTSTVDAPPGFTAIMQEPGYVPKVKVREALGVVARAAAPSQIVVKGTGKSCTISPQLYPTSVICGRLVETVTTKTTTTTAKTTATITAATPTSTVTSTITSTSTSTVYPATVTSTATATVSTTLTSSTATTTTTTTTTTGKFPFLPHSVQSESKLTLLSKLRQQSITLHQLPTPPVAPPTSRPTRTAATQSLKSMAGTAIVHPLSPWALPMTAAWPASPPRTTAGLSSTLVFQDSSASSSPERPATPGWRLGASNSWRIHRARRQGYRSEMAAVGSWQTGATWPDIGKSQGGLFGLLGFDWLFV